MSKINSKAKGSQFERDIANLFNEHFGEGFMRTPNSGATFGKSNRYRMKGIDEGFSHQMTGDLVVPVNFPISIECKFYQDFKFHQLLFGESKQINEWLKQAEDDAIASNKEFFLIMKFNRKGIYVCSKNFKLENNTTLIEKIENYIYYKKQYVIYSLDTFLEISNSIDIIQKWKNNINNCKNKGD